MSILDTGKVSDQEKYLRYIARLDWWNKNYGWLAGVVVIATVAGLMAIR